MRGMLSLFRIRIIAGLQYRSAAWAGVVTQFAWGLMTLLMFQAFYASNPNSVAMKPTQLSSYIWLQQACIALIMIWNMDNEIFLLIEKGAVSYELVRPIDLYSLWMIRSLAHRISRWVLRFWPILLIALFLPDPFRLHAPESLIHFMCFILSLSLTLVLICVISLLVYTVAFYTISSRGIRLFIVAIFEILTGSLIPYPFLPDTFRKILILSPFGALQNTPFMIYNGMIAGSQVLSAIFLQLFWITVLMAFGIVFMKRTLKRIEVMGG